MNRNIKRDMYDYLPKYYHELKQAQAILDTESVEIERLNSEIKDVLDQFFIDTATWGLSRWEYICGIETDNSKTYEERRAVIKSKLRGAGTASVTLIKEVVEAYDGGSVDVEENNAEYEVIITFIDTRGVPTNIEDTKRALAEVIPAHLAIRFVFNYLTWDELDAKRVSWNDLDSIQITWDELSTYKFE